MVGSSLIQTWVSSPLEILFPLECLVCTRPLRGQLLCFRCAPSPIPLSISRCNLCFGALSPLEDAQVCITCLNYPLAARRIRYLWEYEGLARDFIRAMKYQPSYHLARLAGGLLTHHLPALVGPTSWDLVIPVPSSPAMLKKRLFHPCAEIARGMLENHSSLTPRHHLKHRGGRSPQAHRSHADRLRGLRGIFCVNSPREIAGKRVLLIEDVITTGATIAAACHTLHEAGAESVDVVALAQAPVWRRFRQRVFSLFEPTTAAVTGDCLVDPCVMSYSGSRR
jgi:predicted amidophosphoribosyltransferase